jgi:hypothetical protein
VLHVLFAAAMFVFFAGTTWAWVVASNFFIGTDDNGSFFSNFIVFGGVVADDKIQKIIWQIIS